MSDGEIGRRGVLSGAGLLLATPGLVVAQAKPQVAITTDKGVITLTLEPGKAPVTTANFLRYVAAAKYDGGQFFRAARTKGAPQLGSIVASPNLRAQPYPAIGHEPTTKTGLRHKAGTISLGRFAPGTARGDFFICVSDLPYLDANPKAKGDNLGFAAFGQVVSGMSVVRRILAAPTSQESKFPEQRGQWLAPPVRIISAKRIA
jgi:peptidyl-prolyl cis-trans isomerase A (cyclophilin A)